MTIRISFSLILVFFALKIQAQNSLTGKVLDSLTRKPIPYVNVYFANTTIGTVTDEHGEFAIKGFSSGKYALTASFLGYTIVQLPLDFNGTAVNKTIILKEQIIQLNEVQVKVDSTEWEENFDIFKKNFLGLTKNASQLVIKNPRNLRLYLDPHDVVLVAFAKQPVEIENRALGYKIFYQLKDFQVDFKNDKMVYIGIPRFLLLEPKGPKELGRWEEARKRAYAGSFSHFIQSIKRNELHSNGFEVYTIFRIPNTKRPDEKYLNDRISSLRKKYMEIDGTVSVDRNSIRDSLNYYSAKLALPKVIDSVGHKIADSRELFAPGSNNLITYRGILQVTYKNEREENNYTPDKPPLKQQQSIIHFLGNSIKLYENGYYEDVRDVFFEGYMGWSEKLAELLPQDFIPEEAITKQK